MYLCAMKNTGDRLHALRKSLGMTQKELSRRSGISATTIGAIESGCNFGVRTLESLCTGLGVKVVFLTEDQLNG